MDRATALAGHRRGAARWQQFGKVPLQTVAGRPQARPSYGRGDDDGGGDA